MRVTVLSAMGTKVNIRAIIGIDVCCNPFLGTVMGASMSNLQIIWIQRYISRMVLKTVQGTRCRMLFPFLHARFTSQIHEFKRVRPTCLTKWRGVINLSVLVSVLFNLYLIYIIPRNIAELERERRTENVRKHEVISSEPCVR